MYTYEQFKHHAETSRARKLANNTYLVIRNDGGYAVKLHNTEIVIHYPDRVVLDSGGWQTRTTKDRINTFSRINVSQSKGVWSANGLPYADGITFFNDGTTTGQGVDHKATIKQRNAVKAYAKKYVKALAAGKVPAPSMGDCWGCCMVSDDGQNPIGGADHIHSHIKENYFVPSLLNRCKDRLSQVACWYIASKWQGSTESFFYEDIALTQIESAIKHFCLKELGLPV